MIEFTVHGPFTVPVNKGKGGRVIRTQEGQSFFQQHPDIADETGCYIFALKAAGGYKPMYVGKAARSFRKEVFAPHKRARYAEALASISIGKPVLFLIVHPGGKSESKAARIIDEVETFLIQMALRANKRLLNIQRKERAPQWAIKGVVGNIWGKPAQSAANMMQCLKLSRLTASASASSKNKSIRAVSHAKGKVGYGM